jgi:RimJ/RimL family protein N-acetyltransferase
MNDRLDDDIALPIGALLPNWSPPCRPLRLDFEGRYCRLEPLNFARHSSALFEANAADVSGQMWTYMAYGPFTDLDEYRHWMTATCLGDDPLFFTIVDLVDSKPAGLASYLRITPASGSIEVGHLQYSPKLQRSRAATEAMYLMMRRAFELGYRRYEWKCDALNAASRRAALRLGFTFEGVFRQATVYKGRNRDTAWHAIIDRDWPRIREVFERWLEPSNFEPLGRQRSSLSELMRSSNEIVGASPQH